MSKDIIPPHFSYSSLTTYMECNHKWYLSKIARVPEIPSWWLVGGSAVHTLTEIYDLDREKFQERGLDQLWQEVFNAEVQAQQVRYPAISIADWRTAGRKSKAKPDGEDYLAWMDLGPEFVQHYITWRLESGLELWDGAITGFDPDTGEYDTMTAVELPLDFDIHGWHFKGAIDRVFVQGDELLVIDLKSGSRMPESGLQLGSYAVGLEVQYGSRPVYGQYFNLRQNKFSSLYDLSRYTVDSLGELGVQFKNGIKNKIFLPHQTNLCNYCPVNSGCAAFGGKDAALYTIDKVIGDDVHR